MHADKTTAYRLGLRQPAAGLTSVTKGRHPDRHCAWWLFGVAHTCMYCPALGMVGLGNAGGTECPPRGHGWGALAALPRRQCGGPNEPSHVRPQLAPRTWPDYSTSAMEYAQ
eukprot:352834-Chlamydomonas_euryale.AAC.6